MWKCSVSSVRRAVILVAEDGAVAGIVLYLALALPPPPWARYSGILCRLGALAPTLGLSTSSSLWRCPCVDLTRDSLMFAAVCCTAVLLEKLFSVRVSLCHVVSKMWRFSSAPHLLSDVQRFLGRTDFIQGNFLF